MFDLKGSSWQQRYSVTQIYTLKCQILDKDGTFAKLTAAIAGVNVPVGDISLVGADDKNQIREITVFIKDEKQLNSLLEKVKSVAGVELLGVRNDVFETHRCGSIDVVSRMPIKSITDLRMVYTPGVASVCQQIEKNPDDAWLWTGICNRVAIITDGTAVLGLGDIGVLPSLPVMEGKASIFAEFAGISAFPILINSKDPNVFVETVMRIAPSFGAIQLEDVAAPACFEIEEKLRAKLNIPVFHDDQHGTATVVLAALINALKKTNRKPADCSAIILGAGAAGIAISYILLEFGIGDIVLYDSFGPIYRGRTEKMNPYKDKIAKLTNKNNQKCPFSEAFTGKDIFIGVARPNMVSKEMIKSMAKNPIVFPLSNPIGEITIEEAFEAGATVAADGRGINNALAYPALFRGALDARATKITTKMQLAAAQKLADLTPKGELLPDILDRQIHRDVAKAVQSAWNG